MSTPFTQLALLGTVHELATNVLMRIAGNDIQSVDPEALNEDVSTEIANSVAKTLTPQ